jgi:hypothetical protein
MREYEQFAGQPPADPRGRHLTIDIESSIVVNGLVDLVALTESFTSTRLLELVPAVKDRDVFSWRDRQKAWLKHGNVNLVDAGVLWIQLQGFVEVRNAFQHGQGRLTESQLGDQRRVDTLKAVRASGVFLDGDALMVGAADLISCDRICADFVRWLDGAAKTS